MSPVLDKPDHDTATEAGVNLDLDVDRQGPASRGVECPVIFVMRAGHVYKNGPPRAVERSTVQSRLSAAVRELVTPRGLEEQAAAIVRHQRSNSTSNASTPLSPLPLNP